jgi:hypothetical protein
LGDSPPRGPAILARCVGKTGLEARYVKEVDADEVTMRFYQEIYDDTGMLVEVHHKYPVDQGHQKVTS